MCRWHCGSHEGKEIIYVHRNDDEWLGGGGCKVEQGDLTKNQVKSFHTDNALVAVRHTPYGYLGDAKVVDGALTILSSSYTTFSYDASTQMLTFSESYSTGLYVIAYNDLG